MDKASFRNARSPQMYSTPRFRFRWPCLQSRGITERKFCRAIIYIMGKRRESTGNLSSDFPMKIHIFPTVEIFLALSTKEPGLLLPVLGKFCILVAAFKPYCPMILCSHLAFQFHCCYSVHFSSNCVFFSVAKNCLILYRSKLISLYREGLKYLLPNFYISILLSFR